MYTKDNLVIMKVKYRKNRKSTSILLILSNVFLLVEQGLGPIMNNIVVKLSSNTAAPKLEKWRKKSKNVTRGKLY